MARSLLKRKTMKALQQTRVLPFIFLWVCMQFSLANAEGWQEQALFGTWNRWRLLALADASQKLALSDGRKLRLDETLTLTVGDIEVVHDLAFAADGGIWLADTAGLRWLSPNPGPNDTRRVLFRSAGVTDIATTKQGALWWIESGDLWFADSILKTGTARISSRREVLLPSRYTTPLVGLAVMASESRLLVASERAFWLQTAGGQAWDHQPLQFESGETLRGLAFFDNRFWFLTQRSLYRLTLGSTRLEKVSLPAGIGKLHALEASLHQLLLLGDMGLFRWLHSTVGPEHAHKPVTAQKGNCDPAMNDLFRAVIQYLDLEPAQQQEGFHALRKRALWPKVSLQLGVDRETSKTLDRDEAFISGDYRHLRDRVFDREHEYHARLSLDWDLSELPFHPDRVDWARETRAWIQLRADLLDEVARLYFERQALLEHVPLPHSQEYWRAKSLAARLDALSGNWFSRNATRLSHASSVSSQKNGDSLCHEKLGEAYLE